MDAKNVRTGKLVDWDVTVPSIHRRAEISGVFKFGGELLNRAEVPNELRLGRPVPSGMDLFISTGGIHIVSPRLHDLLVEMDPGVHQFLSITLAGLKGEFYGDWWVLNVHYRQDTAYDEPGEVKGDRGMAWLGDRAMTVDPARESGVNLWRESRFPSVCVISDRLHAELKRQGIKFFKPVKLKHRTS
jgi:hypothetical protein